MRPHAWTPPRRTAPVLVDGKRLLITGVLTPGSIAYAVAREALDNGAEVVLTGFGRTRSLTERTARRLPREVDVLELDVNQPEDIRSVSDELAGRWGGVDGVLHAIAFAPADALGGNFLNTPYASASTAFQVSAFSLKELTAGLLPVLENHHASVVTLDFDARVAWPVYDWMGVCKAALESVTRYLARDLGAKQVRVQPTGRRLVQARPPRLGRRRPDGRGPGRPVAILRLVARGLRGADPRRRRLPRDGHRPALQRGAGQAGGRGRVADGAPHGVTGHLPRRRRRADAGRSPERP